MPMIIASAVMHTGRSRVVPAISAACFASLLPSPSPRESLAKVTTRMLFAVAIPIVISAPISDGTLNVVWVRNNIHTIPAKAPGSAMRMMNGMVHD